MTTMICNYFCLLFILLLSNLLYAGSVSGKVTDTDNNTLPGASVFIEGSTIGTVSDSSGYFELSGIPDGSSITISYTGYKSSSVDIQDNSGTPLKVILHHDVLYLQEVLVRDQRIFSASSSQFFNAFDFELRVKQSAQDLLQVVPGLITAQHAGGGKAEQIFLRGFDADHGTDVNVSVDGIPVNMVSHAHGQGYADLHFVIPEILKGMEVQKGPYSPDNGDFATAGAVKFKTLDRIENDFFSIERGSFNSLRAVGGAELPLGIKNNSLYLATEYLNTDSYFESKQNFNRYNVFLKNIIDLSSNSHLALSLSGFISDWDASGQIPSRAVASGLISRFGSIDNTEGGNTSRYNLNLQYNSAGVEGSLFTSQLYLTKYYFDLFSNFTFFLNDPVNGDQIEQKDNRILFGYNGMYSAAGEHFGLKSITTVGGNFRADNMEVELWNTKARERLTPSVNAAIWQRSLGIFAEEEMSFTPELKAELSLRGDYFMFDVKDLLTESGSGSKNEFVISQKFNMMFTPLRRLDLFFNAGYGFHSNDARAVIAGSNQKTLPRAVSLETGLRINLFESFYLSSAFWMTDLENEFVYVGDEGTTEANGPTRRLGIDVDLRAQLSSWLWWDIDVNFSRGRFKETNEYIPLAPDFTSSGGLTARLTGGLEGSIRFIHISDRPANEDNSVTALGSTIFDVNLVYKTGIIKFGLVVKNLFNQEWNEAQFDTESKLANETEPVSELHFTPGSPSSVSIMMGAEF